MIKTTRLLLGLLLLAVCAGTAQATDITIASFSFSGYTKSSAPRIRVYFSHGFTDSNGVFVPGGSPQRGVVYKVVNTTLLAGVVTVPAFIVPSTRDGIDDRTATMSVYVYDGNTLLQPNPLEPYVDLTIPSSITSSTGCSPLNRCGSLAEIRNLQSGVPPLPSPQYYDAPTIDRLLATVAVGAPVAAPYVTTTPDSTLTNEFAISTLTDGILKHVGGTPATAIANTDYLTPTGNGSGLTALNATQLSSGTIPDARFPATLPAASGVNLTALNASNLASGTVPDARFPATLPVASGVNLTALNATQLTSGTVPDARFPATLPAASGVNLTALVATQLTSGLIPIARGQEVWGLVDLSDVTAKKGNSTIVQMQTGATTTGDCAQFDSNGNIVSFGGPCASGGGSGTVSSGLAGLLAYYPSNGTTVDDFPTGTANQILGMNSTPNGHEYKTLAVGTSGTDFAIAHSIGGVTFNLPSASASNRGAVTTGVQTFAGEKTFTGRIFAGTTPVYDLATSVLAVDMMVTHVAVNVASGKVLNIMRLSQSDGADNTYTITSGGQVAQLYSGATASSGSGAAAVLYSGVFGVTNASPGETKAIHVQAIGSGTSTGTLMGAAIEVRPVATSPASSSWAIQASSTGVANLATGLGFSQVTTSNWRYGIDMHTDTNVNVYTNGAIRLTNNTNIVARNAANSADIALLKLNASTEIEFGGATGVALVSEGANPSIRLGSAVAGWSFQKVDSDNRFRFLKGGAGEVFSITENGVTNLFLGGIVPSSATITISGNTFHVSGTTNITSVSATGIASGTVITIIFDGILTFTDGSNLSLAGNFVTTAGDSITLVYDGVNWVEIARSIN